MSKKLHTLFLVLLVLASTPLSRAEAALVEPVKWSFSIEMLNDTEGKFIASASVESGWHLYGTNLPDGGPKPTKINFSQVSGAELVGGVMPSIAPKEAVDEIFNLKLSWWGSDVTLVQHFKLAKQSSGAKFVGDVSYQACNDRTCIAPAKTPFDESTGVTISDMVVPDDSAASQSADADERKTMQSVDELHQQWWKRADFSQYEDAGSVTDVASSSWWHIFLWGFISGLLALMTPCVWPMIPMTVSFFLKKSKNRRRSVRDAMIYGTSIVAIYLMLGLAVTLIFGASKLNELSTSAIFNLAFFVLLLVFAISFFGAFEIKLPAKWSNLSDGKAESTTGLISIFFMAFTLALVSFSCTGPLIGTLLVEAAADGEITGPAIGMGAFALALAIPFALFALFPSWLNSMPRSGGWLNSVKVVLGFLELALSLKFLSVADMAYGWRILDREIFLCLWIAIFVLLGMYLLGKLRFAHDAELKSVSITRFFLALASWCFALYLLPGLWGAPLKGVSAFVPPLTTQDFNLYQQSESGSYEDFDAGMEAAVKRNLPVLVDFSGYGCVNCRKMEGAVFDNQEVRSILNDDFIIITLMVDDKQPLSSPLMVEENGRKVKLETVGDKWSYLQRTKFAANVQPYYVILGHDGQPLSQPYFYDENVPKFVEWLNNGIAQFRNKQ